MAKKKAVAKKAPVKKVTTVEGSSSQEKVIKTDPDVLDEKGDMTVEAVNEFETESFEVVQEEQEGPSPVKKYATDTEKAELFDKLNTIGALGTDASIDDWTVESMNVVDSYAKHIEGLTFELKEFKEILDKKNSASTLQAVEGEEEEIIGEYPYVTIYADDDEAIEAYDLKNGSVLVKVTTGSSVTTSVVAGKIVEKNDGEIIFAN